MSDVPVERDYLTVDIDWTSACAVSDRLIRHSLSCWYLKASLDISGSSHACRYQAHSSTSDSALYTSSAAR